MDQKTDTYIALTRAWHEQAEYTHSPDWDQYHEAQEDLAAIARVAALVLNEPERDWFFEMVDREVGL